MLFSSILWLYYYISNLLKGTDDSSSDSILNFSISFNDSNIYEPLYFSSAYSFLVDGEVKSTKLEPISLPSQKHTSQLIVKMRRSNNTTHVILGKNVSNLQVPAVDDRDTILSLAKISSNAYYQNDNISVIRDPSTDNLFSTESDLDWDSKALRGYIYTNPSKSLVIVAIKGTNAFSKEEQSATADRYNDNLMFSCCCARVDFSWDPVCPCFISGSSCSQGCLVDYARQNRIRPFGHALKKDSVSNFVAESNDYSPVYYHQAVKLYDQLVLDFPNATIWLTGHSLGGAIAALLALTFPGASAIPFASPGERLFAERLGLIPPRVPSSLSAEKNYEKLMMNVPIFHFYDSADPIPNGKCTGLWSLCYLSGYAMETKCHTGSVCTLDSISHPGGNYDIKKHKLSYIIDLLVYGAGSPLPKCKIQNNCADCASWTFIE